MSGRQDRCAWAAGNRIGALRIASRFFDRSQDTLIFKRGMDAWNDLDFYRQIGHDPERLTADALHSSCSQPNSDWMTGIVAPRFVVQSIIPSNLIRSDQCGGAKVRFGTNKHRIADIPIPPLRAMSCRRAF